MKTEFKLDDKKFEKIAKAFSTRKNVYDKSRIEAVHGEYLKYSPLLKEQYLAHAMRALECYFRDKFKDKRFIIFCEPYKTFFPGQRQANAIFCEPGTLPNDPDVPYNCFIINYNPSLKKNELKLRDYISHEIGHLFWDAIIRDMPEERRNGLGFIHDNDENIEPLSSIMGVFIMSEKHLFYDNIKTLVTSHKNWQELLDELKKIQGKAYD